MKKAFLAGWLGALSLMAANKPDETFGMKNGHFWHALASDNSSR